MKRNFFNNVKICIIQIKVNYIWFSFKLSQKANFFKAKVCHSLPSQDNHFYQCQIINIKSIKWKFLRHTKLIILEIIHFSLAKNFHKPLGKFMELSSKSSNEL